MPADTPQQGESSRPSSTPQRIHLVQKPGQGISPHELAEWAGGEGPKYLAIVYTDIIRHTRTNLDMGDVEFNPVKMRHYVKAVSLANDRDGAIIKYMGDGLMAAFHDTTKALDFAIALERDTGDPKVRIRAGVHFGRVKVIDGDLDGGQASFAHRVMEIAELKEGGVSASGIVRDDVETQHALGLPWQEHIAKIREFGEHKLWWLRPTGWQPPPPDHRKWWFAIAFASAIGAIICYFIMSRSHTTPPPATGSNSSNPSQTVAIAPAARNANAAPNAVSPVSAPTDSTPSALNAMPPSENPGLIESIRPASPPPVPTSAALSPTDAGLNDLMDTKNPSPSFRVSLRLIGGNKNALHANDEFSFEVNSDIPCYITMIQRDSDGNFTLLSPNKYSLQGRIADPAKPLAVPNRDVEAFKFTCIAPFGKTRLRVIATRHPLKLKGVDAEALANSPGGYLPGGKEGFFIDLDDQVVGDANRNLILKNVLDPNECSTADLNLDTEP